MSRHFEITIKVAYEEGTIPEKRMEDELRQGVDAAVQIGLLNDADANAVVEEYSVEVKETTAE